MDAKHLHTCPCRHAPGVHVCTCGADGNVTAKAALERLANIADTAASVLRASAPYEADRFRADAEVARQGSLHLAKLLGLVGRAVDALDDAWLSHGNNGKHPLADELRAALLPPPPAWLSEAVEPARRAWKFAVEVSDIDGHRIRLAMTFPTRVEAQKYADKIPPNRAPSIEEVVA